MTGMFFRYNPGVKSKIEDKVKEQILQIEGTVLYEPEGLKYEVPATIHTYWPDFRLKNGIYIECKDAFTSKDRKKHLWFRATNPNIDVRFVFSNPNRKTVSDSGKSNKHETNASWCTSHDFLYAKGKIPREWFV